MRNIVILNSLHFSYPLPILMRVSYNTLIVKQNTSDYYKYNKYRCKNTGKYFDVKTKTIFQGTRIPLISWFEAIWTILSYKKGISSVQLGENIKVSQKTAWFMMHRIRKALGIDNDVGSEDEGGGGKLSGTVEIDETFNWRKEQEQALEQESSKKSR